VSADYTHAMKREDAAIAAQIVSEEARDLFLRQAAALKKVPHNDLISLSICNTPEELYDYRLDPVAYLANTTGVARLQLWSAVERILQEGGADE